MIQIGSSLGASTSTSVFQTTINEKVWVRVGGTLTATVAMMESLDNSTFAAFNSDGVDQEFAEVGYKLFDMPGGVYFRIDVPAGGSPSLDVHVSGTGISLV